MKNKIIIGLKLIVIIAVLIVSFLLLKKIVELNVLPMKYLSLIIGIDIVLNIIAGVCLLLKPLWTKIFTILIYILLIFGSIVGMNYVGKTDEFLDEAFDNYKTETATYQVVVKSNSNYKSLNDLEGMDVAYFTFYNDTDKIISELKRNIKDVDLRPHDDLYDTFVNFLADKVTSVVLDDASLDILDETYDNLDSRLRVLYTFEIESKVSEKDKNESETIVNSTHSKIDKGNSINIYLSGSDSRSKTIYNKTRTDVNMILSINPDTKTILLTSIPRDYYVLVHGQTGLKDKLTHSGIYGLDISKKTMEDLFDMDIDYAIKVGFTSVVELVDLVGGIEVYSDTEFDSYHMKGWHVEKGNNYMDGAKALAYARERYAYAGGDRHRILNQQQVLQATLTKITKSTSILTKYDQLLNSLKKLYITDIPRDVISSYVKMQLNDMASWSFQTQSVDGKGSMEPTHVTPRTKLYVMIPDESTVESARAKMKEVLEKRK